MAWQAEKIALNGVGLHYTRTGGGKPPFVLLHGFSDDGLCWSPVAEVLEADYDVVMLDARGHGRSDAPTENYDPLTMAHDAHGVIQALGLEKPLILGHSMGAVTAMLIAAVFPDVPRAILLEDPPPWWLPPAAEQPSAAERAAGLAAWIGSFQTKSKAALMADGAAENPNWSAAELAPWAEAKLRFNPRAIAAISGLNPAEAANRADLLRQIVCPALLLTGDVAKGALVGETAVDALQTLVPQTKTQHIPNAGHSIRRDQFAAYVAAAKVFVGSRLDQS